MYKVKNQKSSTPEENWSIDVPMVLVGGHVYNKREIEKYLDKPILNTDVYYIL